MSEDVDLFEEIYELCQEVIPSVVESLEYLVEFWVKNRDNPTVDLCLD